MQILARKHADHATHLHELYTDAPGCWGQLSCDGIERVPEGRRHGEHQTCLYGRQITLTGCDRSILDSLIISLSIVCPPTISVTHLPFSSIPHSLLHQMLASRNESLRSTLATPSAKSLLKTRPPDLLTTYRDKMAPLDMEVMLTMLGSGFGSSLSTWVPNGF